MNTASIWQEYKTTKSLLVRKQIISNYINLVHYVIHRSKFIKLDVVERNDFFQFGILGLVEAIDRFNPDLGIKFETYAIQRIRGKIIDELRKLQIKPRTNLSEENGVAYQNVSLYQQIESEEGFLLHEIISADIPEPFNSLEEDEQQLVLFNMLKDLPEREQLVITLYYIENLNFQEIAEVLNLTISRVSQMRRQIIYNLRKNVNKYYN